ncbi:MAG: DUF1844 domain-containing protein [Deltaproteobacteria bacterium]|nr:DUF1844 domain-containing protein [Deltaproteobacteria bacterium]
MSQDEERRDSVKVVDRRRLDEDGAERPETEPEAAAPTDASAAATAAAADSGTSRQPVPDRPAAGFPIDFATFIQSLAQQALMHLGLIPYPDTGEHVRELALARQTIDILQVLHEKTRGNLTPEEKHLFDAILHDLRLVYVQVVEGNPAAK